MIFAVVRIRRMASEHCTGKNAVFVAGGDSFMSGILAEKSLRK